MEKNNIIIGSNLLGILVSRRFLDQGIPFIGIEKKEKIGASLSREPFEIKNENTAKALSELFPETNWKTIESKFHQRNKKEWKDLTGNQPSFYSENNWAIVVESLTNKVSSAFQTLKWVSKIDPVENKIVCQDGSEYFYSKLFWCSSLHKLSLTYQGDLTPLEAFKNLSSEGFSAFRVLIEVKAIPFPENYLVHFPFRFKDHKLTAKGMWSRSSEHKKVMDWYCEIPRDFEEDQEEVAKCFKTFRREIFKEFEELESNFVSEKFIYVPKNSYSTPKTVSSLEVLPNIWYLGEELTLLENPELSGNIDNCLRNYESLIST